MKALIGGIGTSLANLYGTSNVYFGDAEESAQYPYIVYSVQASGPAEYSTCGRAAGAMRNTTMQISVWSESSVTSSDMIEAIIIDFENNGVTMSTGNFYKASAIDWTVFVDIDREQAGQRVWQGVAIIEFEWSKGE